MSCFRTTACFLAIATSLTLPAQTPKVDNSTIHGKVLVGYQGWFRCPGDGSPLNVSSHWWNETPAPPHPDTDFYPDTSEYSKASLCTLPGHTIHGKPAQIFSSYPKETTQLHFAWMRQYGIDGVLLQRFINRIPEYKSEHDQVLRNAIAAAEQNGRVLIVEYDLTGGVPTKLLPTLKEDWEYLNKEFKIAQSPAYLKQDGKPIVSIWGLGFGQKPNPAKHNPDHTTDAALALALINYFKQDAHVTVMGGVPTGWRTLDNDSVTDPAWKSVYASLDIVQPWAVGRYHTIEKAQQWITDRLIPDVAATKANHQIYMPVIFPGFSWHNRHLDPPFNATPRLGGRFLWQQAFNVRSAGADAVKIAMFDEMNEGTAIFKQAPTKDDIPVEAPYVTLDADGEKLPSDWYLTVACHIGEVFHGQVKNQSELPKAACHPLP